MCFHVSNTKEEEQKRVSNYNRYFHTFKTIFISWIKACWCCVTMSDVKQKTIHHLSLFMYFIMVGSHKKWSKTEIKMVQKNNSGANRDVKNLTFDITVRYNKLAHNRKRAWRSKFALKWVRGGGGRGRIFITRSILHHNSKDSCF